MEKNKCSDLFQDLLKASDKWVLWDSKARLPIATDPLPSGSIIIHYTEELRKQLDEAEVNRSLAYKEYLEAIEAYTTCLKGISP